jgi:16S rRNA (uracil1498-N3)-methyltransferase
MTRRRWIADEFDDGVALLLGAHAAHLAKTLRAQVGQQYDIACGERVFHGVISSVSDDRVVFDLDAEITPTSASTRITLLLAIFKFDRMEWAIEKCTELNVSSIVPVTARRTGKYLSQAADKRVERWRRIALEAAQQSRRVQPPDIADPVNLERAIEATQGRRIVLAENEGQVELLEALRGHDETSTLSLAVGPEGGWTEGELELFSSAGWVSASLGSTILRAETAAIAALAIAAAELG